MDHQRGWADVHLDHRPAGELVGRHADRREGLARAREDAGASRITQRKSAFSDIEGYQEYATGKATDLFGIRIDGDPTRSTVRLTRVFCPALVNVFGAVPMPGHIFGRYTVDSDPMKNVDEAPENSAPPVASGPFTLKEWRRDDQVLPVRNDRYFKGPPRIAEYVYKAVADPCRPRDRWDRSAGAVR